MKTEYISNLQKNYMIPTYAPKIALVKGEGSKVWDAEGNEYLDFVTGISVCNLGHCCPEVVQAVKDQAEKLFHVSNLFYNENQPELAKLISDNSFGGKVFFSNSGAEANEGMIKFARKWGSESGRNEIICMDASFHGRTLGTLAATGRSKYREGFGPDVQGFVHVPYNDIEAVKAAVSEKTVAVMLEPIQGEGGVIPADKEFMKQVRDLCDEKNMLMLLDEVQSGMGRTGSMFAYQQFDIVPDAMSMAKALANGFPLGAFEVKSEYAHLLTVGTHATTFGGNPIGCAAGIAVFKVFEEQNILKNCQDMSALFMQKLQAIADKTDTIKEVRGMGLLIGVDFGRSAADIVEYCRNKNLLVLVAGETVLRMLPPLNVTEEEVNKAIEIIEEAVAHCCG